MRRLSQDQIGALRSLSVSDAVSEATAVEAGSTWGSNLWNRLYSGGLVGKATAGQRPLFWLTEDGRAALERTEKTPDETAESKANGPACKACSKPLVPGVRFYCDETCGEDDVWCGPCFDLTPCGLGEHGEGCETRCWDDGESATPSEAT